ncbi:hypothetical protein [Absidia glauca]|uniref:Uncharacterized protein n=1 Tax=Absidia glauca TaxID=4829 RepID=A0A168QL20_ABSGL|nr:hypothetical protein [Absidia glauca]
MKVGIKLHNHRSKGRIDTYHITKSPYTTDYRRGCLILQAVQSYQTPIGRACRYGDVQGTNGCARRLVLVAYITAAKYIQSNLRVIVDMTDLPPLTKPISPTKRRHSQDLTLPGLFTERRLSSAMLLSPPVSPKIPQLTDPSQYHYFCGANASNNLGFSEHDRKTTMPSLSDICSDLNHPIGRMESEFLHFLNGDLKVPDCLRLMEWAHSSWL